MTTTHRSNMHRPGIVRVGIAATALSILALLLTAAGAQAVAPGWTLSVAPLGGGGYFNPGANGNASEGPGFLVTATNGGPGATAGTYTITDTLPAGVTPVAGEVSGEDQNGNALSCGTVAQLVTCTGSTSVPAGQTVEVTIPVNVADSATLATLKIQQIVDQAKIEGGGATSSRTAASPVIFLTNNRPAWQIVAMYGPSPLGAGNSAWNEVNFNTIMVEAANIGGAPTTGPVTININMSPGVSITNGTFGQAGTYVFNRELAKCTFTGSEATCEFKESVQTDNVLLGEFTLDTGTLVDGDAVSTEVTINGGGASDAVDQTNTGIDSFHDGPFDFLPNANGLNVMLTGGDGLPSTQAGSHPTNFAVETGWPVGKNNTPNECCLGNGQFGATEGGVRDVEVYTPPGFVLNPRALVKTCFEAQLEQGSCPDESAVGVADAQLAFGGFALTAGQSPLYALDPPYGSATVFGFNLGGFNIFPHIDGFVRSDGDYALGAGSNDILSHFGVPLIGVREHFWGDPTDPIHDQDRGDCGFNPKPGGCPATNRETAPLLSLPTSCGGAMTVEGYTDSWSRPENLIHRVSQVVDSLGNPSGVTGCNALDFSPAVKARPTTNIADSPSGVDFELEVPQNEDLNTLATAHVKKAVVKLPVGFTVNPAGANGLEGCNSSEIGVDPQTAEPNSKQPTCPDASRIGSAEVLTPLLDHVMPGSVYLAEPFDNPFNSLFAMYVVVEDPRSGTLIKLAGEVHMDPATGQVTTTFDNQPQLPYSNLKLNLFGGARATLRTPEVCGTYSSAAEMTPWSGNTPSNLTDSYQIINASNGGTCPTSDAARPNTPSFDAGTLAPVAGAHSPMVVNLRRPDGAQQFSALNVTAPPGLLGKLAGIAYCPDSALVAAAAKSGKQELATPSCPASSRIGTVHVGAGSGPAPYYVQGQVYLTGGYKGGPLGLAIITPAVAGPFDLGTVVTRAAVKLDPVTAQISAISDPLPTMLQGIPLDIRTIQVKLDRPDFTINPTNCDPMAFTGLLTSTLGQQAPLQSRFQVAECANMGFKPKIALKLGGTTKRTKSPSLVATLTARPGDSNIAKARVRLPALALLDNDHIAGVCTKVLFAANQCPPDSVYGSAEATSPLVDYTVKGPVYLRSTTEHNVPDLVAALKGPDNQPIEVDLSGTTDSVKGALRNTFEAVPDVPVSSFRLELLGGSKGLIQLSRNLCAKTYRATIELEGQNGKVADSTPAVTSDCKRKPKHKKHHRRHSHARRGR